MKETSWVLDDEIWHELLELTDGAAAPCYQCGVCTASCPWGVVRVEPFSVRTLIRKAQLGLLNEQDDLWLCTACSQCEPNCPRGVPIASVIQSLRYLMWERRRTIEGLPSILWSIYWNNNPWTQPPSTRRDWDPKSNVPLFDSSTHEILLYIGCTSSYDRRAQHIATALVSILQAANVPFGVLGEEEPCCGESVRSLGHQKYFKDLAQSAANIFQTHGVTKLVTISPHCYDVFSNHYPQINHQFVPQHYSHFLASLIDQNRLVFDQPVHKTITFQDPCFLARHNQTTEQPREILKNIPGVKLVEMEDHALETLCCGGGGGRMWMETPPGERFSDLRVNQALDVGAEVIATACPFCLACLEDSVKAMQIPSLVVLDIAEIAALAITG